VVDFGSFVSKRAIPHAAPVPLGNIGGGGFMVYGDFNFKRN